MAFAQRNYSQIMTTGLHLSGTDEADHTETGPERKRRGWDNARVDNSPARYIVMRTNAGQGFGEKLDMALIN